MWRRFTKEDIQMANNGMKRCLMLKVTKGNALIKPQWDITKHLLKWLKLKRLALLSVRGCGGAGALTLPVRV